MTTIANIRSSLTILF